MVLPIILNVIMLAALLIPAVRGYVAGFVKTALNFFRFFGAVILACVFSKPLGLWIKEKWLGAKFYDLVLNSVKESFDGSASSAADAVPSGFRALLESFKFDVNGAADTAAEGESFLENFVTAVADKLASITSVALAFIAIFLVSLVLLVFVAKLLTFLIEKIPLVRGLNRIAGFGIGLLIGVFTAWTAAQLIVFVLTTFTSVDYSQAAVLNFFHDISPLRWILSLMGKGMSGIAA